jgi:hypothetical protein
MMQRAVDGEPRFDIVKELLGAAPKASQRDRADETGRFAIY